MSKEFNVRELESTSTQLIKGLRAGESRAWERFVDLYAPLVYRWARQAGLQANDISDVSQEVFRTVAGKMQSFGEYADRAQLRFWLWGITRNILRRFFRSSSRRPVALGGSEAKNWFAELPAMLDSDSPPEDPDAERSLVSRALRLIRSDFREDTWKAFYRLTVNGERAADIGSDLDMSDKAVRQAKYRVLCRLREVLETM